MMVTKDGSRKIRQKASAIDRWVKAVTLPMMPAPAEKNRNSQSGRLVVVRISCQRSPRFIRKGRAAMPNTAPKKPDSKGLTRPSMSFTQASETA